jgi:hypothetical protein
MDFKELKRGAVYYFVCPTCTEELGAMVYSCSPRSNCNYIYCKTCMKTFIFNLGADCNKCTRRIECLTRAPIEPKFQYDLPNSGSYKEYEQD